jgi:hypothetical protein
MPDRDGATALDTLTPFAARTTGAACRRRPAAELASAAPEPPANFDASAQAAWVAIWAAGRGHLDVTLDRPLVTLAAVRLGALSALRRWTQDPARWAYPEPSAAREIGERWTRQCEAAEQEATSWLTRLHLGADTAARLVRQDWTMAVARAA